MYEKAPGRLNITNAENVGGVERKKWEEVFLRFGHPFPTVVIDRVEELERGKKIKAVKWVTADELYLSGHFPGEPIMPGVLTLEGLIQSALIFLEESFTRGNIRISLEKVERLRFKRAVLPGDRLDFLVSLTGKEGNLWKFKGKAQVGAEVAAEADVILKVDVREVGFEL
ncbi:MAG: 3-hydroxyacyl-ACP dehydratase FabZ [Proteobacteria bacterium]|nr:3-hydroxyacyl-ACP dehydratase FabZ [Pseudomonadota bacterium]